MGASAGAVSAVRSVRASVNYVDEAAGRGVYEILDNDRSSLPLRRVEIEVRDARTAPEPATLEREGFTLARAPTAVTDFADQGQILRTYLPELGETIRRLYGAAQVWMSPGTVIRVTDPAERAARHTPDAARFLHLDYSSRSAPEFLADTLGFDAAQARQYRRIFAVNTWRSITPPPQDVPLAVCDKRSSSLDDLVVADANYQAGPVSKSFEITLVRHNPAHRWWFYSGLGPEELMVFKGWDLSPRPTPSCIHGAFVDPTCSPDAPPRVSIEARGFALFED
jgi:hypothetical protein